MITERQENLLKFVVKEYISNSEPVSSKLLKKAAGLDICEATVRNDLQELTEAGYIEQPHTSAGRIPTKKAYQHFADKLAANREEVLQDFIEKEMERARKQIENEMRLAEELMKSLSEISSTLSVSYSYKPEKETIFEILTILGPSKSAQEKNRNIINQIIKELENF